jgi:biopolymer transport protein ExbD
MRFYPKQRRRPPGIIIVALIDVLIVLVIFLMVTTTFKQQPALKLALPESSQAVKTGANENAPLIISIDPQGVLRFGADSRPVTVEGLREELAQAVAKNPGVRLAISADKAAPWGQVVRVMDAAKQAHVAPGAVNAFMKQAAAAQ